MKILVDMDGVIADLLPRWLELINKVESPASRAGDYKIADITSWNTHECVNLPADVCYGMLTPELFASLDPLPGAIETLQAWRRCGHEVRICTAPSAHPGSGGAKVEWVRKHLGWTEKDMFLCHSKDWIKADMLIDDGPHNLASYRAMWGRHPLIVKVMYPYNRLIETDRTVGYDDPDLWLKIAKMPTECMQ